jgi:plastocyanin
MVVAGCGAGGSTPGFTYAPPAGASTGTTPSGSVSGSAASGSTITLSLKEYSITPATVTIKAGTPVTFEAHNEGTISHALLISGNGVNLATKDLAFQPGTTETIAATLAAGTYTFICPVDGHAGQGMKGTITVTP